MNASTGLAIVALLLAPHACLPATPPAKSGDGFEHDATAGTWLARANDARFIQALRSGRRVTIVAMGTSLTGGTWRWPDVMMNDWLNRNGT